MVRLTPKTYIRPVVAALLLLSLLLPGSSLIRFADAYTITVTADRTVPADLSVGGDVNSTPSGISCTNGTSGTCSYLFTDGIEIILAANPNTESIFYGWGALCSGTGSCVFTPNADTVVNATFSPNYQATVRGHSLAQYTTLTDAYAKANDQSTVAAHVYTFVESLTLDQAIFIRLFGGREGTEYLSHADADFTTLSGTLEIRQGSVEIDSLIIQ